MRNGDVVILRFGASASHLAVYRRETPTKYIVDVVHSMRRAVSKRVRVPKDRFIARCPRIVYELLCNSGIMQNIYTQTRRKRS